MPMQWAAPARGLGRRTVPSRDPPFWCVWEGDGGRHGSDKNVACQPRAEQARLRSSPHPRENHRVIFSNPPAAFHAQLRPRRTYPIVPPIAGACTG